MGFTTKKPGAGRLIVMSLMARSLKYHAPVTGTFEWDVTDLLAEIEKRKAQGESVGIAAFMTRATALTLVKHPQLNRRLFHTWYGARRIVHWEEISCNLVVSRERKDGPEIIMPVLLRNVDERSVAELHETIRDLKQAPLDTLPTYAAVNRLGRMPGIVRWLLNALVIRSPRFFLRHFGTYNLSALIHEGSRALGGSAISPATTFYPTNIQEKAVVHQGSIQIRKMMMFGMCMDHMVVDGLAGLRACQTLQAYIENPHTVFDHEPPA